MYNIIKTEIKGGRKLPEVTRLINIAMGAGKLTEAQFRELNEAVLNAANPDENQPDLRQMVLALEERVKALENYNGLVPAPDTPEEGGEYPAWKPWDGISQDYQQGAIVTHNGKLWQSAFAGQNTWEPGTIGTEALWREYTA